MANEARQIKTREQAHADGDVRFFTGKPCKRGHLSDRYVSTNGCVECVNGTFKRRVNTFSHNLVPYHAQRLWIPTGYSPEHAASLEKFLQQCIAEHARVNGLLSEETAAALRAQIERM